MATPDRNRRNPADYSPPQFTLRTLFKVTTVVAVLLGIIRCGAYWPDIIVLFAALCLLAVIYAPIILLTKRNRDRETD